LPALVQFPARSPPGRSAVATRHTAIFTWPSCDFCQAQLSAGARSSAGQSSCLLSSGSRVRILPGAPASQVRALASRTAVAGVAASAPRWTLCTNTSCAVVARTLQAVIRSSTSGGGLRRGELKRLLQPARVGCARISRSGCSLGHQPRRPARPAPRRAWAGPRRRRTRRPGGRVDGAKVGPEQAFGPRGVREAHPGQPPRQCGPRTAHASNGITASCQGGRPRAQAPEVSRGATSRGSGAAIACRVRQRPAWHRRAPASCGAHHCAE
jgi:hypothetical protein